MKILTSLALALLLLDVAPCGGCGNQRPVDRTPEQREQAEQAAPPAEAPSPADDPAPAQPAE